MVNKLVKGTQSGTQNPRPSWGIFIAAMLFAGLLPGVLFFFFFVVLIRTSIKFVLISNFQIFCQVFTFFLNFIF